MTFPFLPTNKAEMRLKGWDSVDIILITGDAYVDHPSFGAALIGRYLESRGFRVGIIAQPDWTKDDDFLALGKPNLFFGVTGGNLDSMIANYNSEKKSRKKDEYTAGGEPGKRPDRAVIVYTNMIRKLFPGSPVIIGGLEASLRRLTYYDYWSNKLRRSILFDSKADLLVYGMGEKAIVAAAERLKDFRDLKGIKNTAYISDRKPSGDILDLPAHEILLKEKVLYLKAVKEHEQEYAKKKPRKVVQECQKKFIIAEPPDPLNSKELDELYTLPFTREPHPGYQEPIPAYSFVKHSVVAHRGCYGGCSFCTLTLHQGKYIVSRSEKSILNEIQNVIGKQQDFKGNILDIGGPSADMWQSRCKKLEGCGRLSCLVPSVCPNLEIGHKQQLSLLQKARSLPGIKRIFINSGIRIDQALLCPQYIDELTRYHVSGQLSLAPEHNASDVLKLMQKPKFSLYEQFVKLFNKANKKYHKEQYIIPYLIASHPGCTLQNMHNLSEYLRQNKLRVQQVQNYIPIPMTLSSAMYYSETDPFSLKPIHVAKGEERRLQRALLQPWLKANKPLHRKALEILKK
ncbi:YgiQ family radical SAM protein [Candidatus Margulisiibacteriota bacterium]